MCHIKSCWSVTLGILYLALGLALNAQAQTGPISIDGFSDGVKHYRDKSGREDYPRYDVANVISIGDNLLVWQRSNGGWPANQDPLRILSAAHATNSSANVANQTPASTTETRIVRFDIWPRSTRRLKRCFRLAAVVVWNSCFRPNTPTVDGLTHFLAIPATIRISQLPTM